MFILLDFISLYLISSSSTSFKLRLELNKIDFVLFSPKCILSLLFTNQSQILLKSLVNCFFISVTFLLTINDLNISTSCILQLGSYHSHKWKTIEGLKLSLAKHHMKYLQISYKIIHTKWSYSLKSLLEQVCQGEFCDLSYQMLFVGQPESC